MILAALEKTIIAMAILESKAIVVELKGDTKAKLINGDICGESPLLL